MVRPGDHQAIHEALPGVLPDAFPEFGEHAPLDLATLSARTEQQIAELLVSSRFDAWSQAPECPRAAESVPSSARSPRTGWSPFTWRRLLSGPGRMGPLGLAGGAGGAHQAGSVE